jgi:hypothetical protein
MRWRKKFATAEGIGELIRKGHGAGELKAYKGWVRHTDFSSKGVSGPQPCATTGRHLDLLSRGEKAYGYILDWALVVADINEQFPQLPFEETVALAERHGIKHPVDRHTGHPWVLTSDFRLVVQSPDGRRVAVRTVKERKELSDRRVLQKLEIERLYWKARGVDWGIIVSEDIPDALVRNIRWIHDFLCRPQVQKSDESSTAFKSDEIASIAAKLQELIHGRPAALNSIAGDVDLSLGLTTGSSLNVIRLLIAQRIWKVDMRREINPDEPLDLLGVNSEFLKRLK